MMTAEKIDFFKESVNATYSGITGAMPHAVNPTQSDFMKTLEKSTATNDNEMSIIDKSQQDRHATNDTMMTGKNEDRRDNEKIREQKEPSDQTKTESDNEKKATVEKPKEKTSEKPSEKSAEKQVDPEPKKNQDNTATESAEMAKAKKGGATDERATALKEILKQHHVQIQRIGEIKEDMKESFTETKAMSPTNTAEKLMLNKLGEDKDHTAKTNKSKNSKDEESGGDKKILKEIETAQKEETAALQKNEPKAEKPVKNQDSPVFSLTNDSSKTPASIPDAKIPKTPTSQTLLDQYQGLRDKINQNVENSIKFMLANGENRISMKLYPPELGRVEVELTIKDNKLHAKINTENTAVKEVIQSNLEQLKSNLQNAGTTIHKMDVEVGGFKNQFDQNFSNGTADSGGGRHGHSSGNEGGTSKDPNEPSPGKITNHKAQSYFLGRSINVII